MIGRVLLLSIVTSSVLIGMTIRHDMYYDSRVIQCYDSEAEVIYEQEFKGYKGQVYIQFITKSKHDSLYWYRINKTGEKFLGYCRGYHGLMQPRRTN